MLTSIAEFVDPNPNTGNQFGASLVALSSGNVVITSPFDDFGGTDAGAVYLFNGATGTLISTIRGSKPNDNVGSGGVVVLSNGNYVIRSPFWDNGTAFNSGAVTWASKNSGIAGIVNSSNSLVGSSNDVLGSGGVKALANGNYVVCSPSWKNGAASSAGAVTWGNGATGRVGVVSATNSLVGIKSGDQIGSGGITELPNGNYVVKSPLWDNASVTNVGAVTWGNGATGTVGNVGLSNSLVGNTTGDQIGTEVKALTNSNYLVRSPNWDNGLETEAGAVTWGNGTTGTNGIVSSANSLVGSKSNDLVGNALNNSSGITTLPNGNYLITSSQWDNGTLTNAGAVTWGNGATGIAGTIAASNSLVGSSTTDVVGNGGITVLTNGNYVVRSSNWDNTGAVNAGAVTWGNGSTGISGSINSSNSLVGNNANDEIGISFVTPLANGNYIVNSPNWSPGNFGAVTWGSGTTGVTGVVSAANSLVGTKNNDAVGWPTAVSLTNGNYVVTSQNWDNGNIVDAGAATWGNGNTGIVGQISAANSLVGNGTNDNIGCGGVTALTNGNYVVRSQCFGTADKGAATWGNGTSGTVGVVSASNSLVGGAITSDSIGSGGIVALRNGNYVVLSPLWDNQDPLGANFGAVTWGNGTTGSFGIADASNSIVGNKSDDGVGNGGVTELENGNYVIRSFNWDNGTVTNAGAVTLASGTTSIVGIVSSSNSLVGSRTNDNIGGSGIMPLSNGNFVVRSAGWDNDSVVDAGAITWASGLIGAVGPVNSSNSLIGQTAGDAIGSGNFIALQNGNFILRSPLWDNGSIVNAGSVTWGSGTIGLQGLINSSNSLVGLVANSNLQSISLDLVNQTFMGPFLSEGSGRVRVGSTVNLPPVVNPATFSIAENSIVSEYVGSVSASEPNGQIFGFSIIGGNTNGAFAINNAGDISVSNPVALDYENFQSFQLTVQATDVDIPSLSGIATITINLTDVSEIGTIVSRKVFYNNATGSNLSSAGAANDAIASDKNALLPGFTSSYTNYTNYSRGLNGLIIDIANLTATTTEAELLASLYFASWNGISPSGFLSIRSVPTITIHRGSGVDWTTRVKITFPDHELKNTWLRVTVPPLKQTGLNTRDEFYFGHVLGELNVDNTVKRLRVNHSEIAAIIANQTTEPNSASVSNPFDLDRDGRVNEVDTSIVIANQQTEGTVAPIYAPNFEGDSVPTLHSGRSPGKFEKRVDWPGVSLNSVSGRPLSVKEQINIKRLGTSPLPQPSILSDSFQLVSSNFEVALDSGKWTNQLFSNSADLVDREKTKVNGYDKFFTFFDEITI